MATRLPQLDQSSISRLLDGSECDIAYLNLIAAGGLPGTSDIEVDQLLETLEHWADRVKLEIWRHLYRFDPRSLDEPDEFSHGNSLGRFLCWYMLQTLQLDCGVSYREDRKFAPDFCEPADLFIHGIVDDNGEGGTCASMPVVYVAVGRRLGFPLYLVETKSHLFFRWDDPHGTTLHWKNPPLDLWIPPDRFNVDGSGEGIAYHDDAYYMQWPEPWTDFDFDHARNLRSLSPTEDLAAFLIQRAECFEDLKRPKQSLEAIALARYLVPDDPRYQMLEVKLQHQLRAAHAQMEAELAAMMRDREQRERKLRANFEFPDHGPTCQCARCQQRRQANVAKLQTPHGQSCQCLECRRVRETVSQFEGSSDHLPHCPCPACQALRSIPLPPMHAATPMGLPAPTFPQIHSPTPRQQPSALPPPMFRLRQQD